MADPLVKLLSAQEAIRTECAEVVASIAFHVSTEDSTGILSLPR